MTKDGGSLSGSKGEILDMQADELSEVGFININKERSCDKKDEGVPEEVTFAINFTLKELSEMFHKIESANDKMLDADPNLEKSMTISMPRHRKDA